MTRRTLLSLRALESRDAPSGIDSPPLSIDGPPNHVAGDEAGGARAGRNTAPVISDFRAVVGPNGQVTFTGRVTDDTPVTGYVVRITGPGVDTYAIVDRDGTFRTTTVVTGTVEITVSAQTTDSGGLKSNTAYTTFLPS